MITVLLLDSSEKCLASIGAPGNERWLCGHSDLILMDDVDEYSYSLLNASRMPALLKELQEVKKRLTSPDAVAHLEKIESLAMQLEENQKGYLVFTPFERPGDRGA